MGPFSLPIRQRGVVLLLAMVFSAMMSVLAVSALRVSALEARMAGNATSRMASLELADSILVGLLQEPDSFPLSLAPGLVPCPVSVGEPECPVVFSGVQQEAVYRISRLAPALFKDFSLREAESKATGVSHFNTAIFEVAVTVGSPRGRSGHAHVIQGVAVRVPAGDA
jgi:hypothetical protein